MWICQGTPSDQALRPSKKLSHHSDEQYPGLAAHCRSRLRPEDSTGGMRRLLRPHPLSNPGIRFALSPVLTSVGPTSMVHQAYLADTQPSDGDRDTRYGFTSDSWISELSLRSRTQAEMTLTPSRFRLKQRWKGGPEWYTEDS